MTESKEPGLTKRLMEQVSRKIINSYREREFTGINNLYSWLRDEPVEELEEKVKNRFYYLIKAYHPDMLQTHQAAWEMAASAGDKEKLSFYTRMASPRFSVPGRHSGTGTIGSGGGNSTGSRGMDFDPVFRPDETYSFTEDDFGFMSAEDSGTIRDVDMELTFLEALNAYFFGNLGHVLEPVDLLQVQGALDLPDLGLFELDGIEHCTQVSSLNLSGNRIDNIFDLQYLGRLRELDLSGNNIVDIEPLKGLDELEILYLEHNEIDDISPLLLLPELKFVTIYGNPINGMEVISALIKRGVTVIYFT